MFIGKQGYPIKDNVLSEDNQNEIRMLKMVEICVTVTQEMCT